MDLIFPLLQKFKPSPCSYLALRDSTVLGQQFYPIPSSLALYLLERGFRHSGSFWYTPACDGCKSCLPLRIAVKDFRPTKRQRRTVRKNQDINYEFGIAKLDQKRLKIYQDYLAYQHPDSPQSGNIEELEEFLYTKYPFSRELCFYYKNDLVAISILDFFEKQALSSVYHYFDPRLSKRSLGVYSALIEIELCKSLEIPYYYLGYWVPGSKSMDYKKNYGPHEILWQAKWYSSNDTDYSHILNGCVSCSREDDK